MFQRWCEWMKRRGSWKMVRRNGTEDYLERFYLLRLFGHALFLHCFWASDQDPLHDHPWDYARLILSGGYWETGADGRTIWRGSGAFAFRSAEVLHRVNLPAKLRGRTWTLFYHGRRWRRWGFMHPTASGPAWVAALVTGNQDTRPMRGVLFPRFDEELG